MEKKITKTELDECADMIQKCRSEAAKRVVGQTQIVDGILTALIAGGHGCCAVLHCRSCSNEYFC